MSSNIPDVNDTYGFIYKGYYNTCSNSTVWITFQK